MAKKLIPPTNYIWLISYIDSEQVQNVEKDLKRKAKYKDVQAFIPMVRVLNKQFKGKSIFNYVPLLFNYGFFKVPLESALNREFISGMKEDISCIYGWVRDGMRKPKDHPCYSIQVALATAKEITQIMKSQANHSIYSAEDLSRVKVGDIISLKGYPFDNIQAEIKHIDFNKSKVRVLLQLDSLMKEVTVSFENVFYSIYQGGYDESNFSEKSLDEIKEKNNGSLDKLFATL